MNKLLLKLPTELIKNYVLKNFSNLTVEEYFYVVKKGIKIPGIYYEKNQEFISNPLILKYVLANDFYSLVYFNKEAFNEENINLISKTNNELYVSTIKNHQFLLDNNIIKIKFIKNNPSYIKFLKREQITEDVVEFIETSLYTVDEEDIKKYPNFLTNEKIMTKAISKNNSLILLVPNITNKMIQIILQKLQNAMHIRTWHS